MPSLPILFFRSLFRLVNFKENFSSEKGLARRIRQNQSDRRQVPDPPAKMYRDFDITRRTVQGSDVYRVQPKTGNRTRRILYWHGGAYVSNMNFLYWRFIGRLISLLDASITVPIYPLLPDHTCQELSPFALAVYQEIVCEESPESLIVMGDSAGGGIALALAQEAHARGIPQPAALVLISPWLDVTMTDPELKIIDARDPQISIPGLIAAGEMYAGPLPKTDPRVSPIYGSMAGLPPIQLFAGTDELPIVDARKLKAAAEAQGVSVEYHEGDRLFHVWPILVFMSPEARQACDHIRDFAFAHWPC